MLPVFLLFALAWLLITSLMCWYYLDSFFSHEDYVTNDTTTKKIGQYLSTHYSQQHSLYDVGSSRGTFALTIATLCPNLAITGIDNGLLRILISRVRARLQNKHITFLKKDFLSCNMSEADIIYVYVPRALLSTLALKLQKEARPTAVVITSRITFAEFIPNETIPKNPSVPNEEDIFIYKAPFIKSVI